MLDRQKVEAVLTRRFPGVYLRGMCVWLYVRGSVLIGMSLSVALHRSMSRDI